MTHWTWRASVLAAAVAWAACGGAEPEAASADLTEAAPTCADTPPGDAYTCGQQVGWGQCGEPWMDGHCDRSCGRCPGIGVPAEVCVDEAPSDAYTCAQQASWGKCDEAWMDGYCEVSCNRCAVSQQPIDPAASEPTRALFRYLVQTYRTAVIAGQQGLAEADYMRSLTGRSPAILGLDLMNYSPSRVARGSSSTAIEEAIEWADNRGGIVTLSWHWNAPDSLVDSEEWPWWKGFYTKGTTFDFNKAMSQRDSAEHALILRDIDAIAIELRRLQDRGIPVLWRPIHEASGKWFWWGAHGPEPYIALWRLLYDRLVNHHQLHNLIWVWNGQHRDFYPGDTYVDIAAEDIYGTELDPDPEEQAYLDATAYTTTPKLVALSETGALPDPQRLQGSRARWSWFMLWSGDFATTETWNADTTKRAVYDSDFVITLDELPPEL